MKAPTTTPELEAAATLRAMIMGFRTTQLLSVAARLELADRLGEAEKSAHELALR